MAFDSFYEMWFAAVWSAARQNPACGAAESATAYALHKAVTDRLEARCRSVRARARRSCALRPRRRSDRRA
jgi:hypothetical protein